MMWAGGWAEAQAWSRCVASRERSAGQGRASLHLFLPLKPPLLIYPFAYIAFGFALLQEAKDVEVEESGETPDCSADPLPSGQHHHSSSMLTGAGGGAAVQPRVLPPPGQAMAARRPTQREASGREGAASGRLPSSGTARASGSVLSGECSQPSGLLVP